MRRRELTDLEKSKLIAIFALNRICAPGLDSMAVRIVESISGKKARELAEKTLLRYLLGCESYPLAETVARRQTPELARAAALAIVGAALSEHTSARARDYLSESETLLQRVREPDDRGPILQEIAIGYGRMKDWTKALSIATEITPAGERVFTLSQIAMALWKSGAGDAAKKTLDDARRSVSEVSLREQASSLLDLAKATAEMGRASEAVGLLEEAIRFAEHAPESSKVLYSVCQALIALGQHERAREIAHSIESASRKIQALSLFD